MELFTDAGEILQGQSVIRAVIFIFVFLGIGIFLESGQKSSVAKDMSHWQHLLLRVAVYACYALSLLNVFMAINWIIFFFI